MQSEVNLRLAISATHTKPVPTSFTLFYPSHPEEEKQQFKERK